jgi:uncharacterized protein (TIGR03083 family)
VTRPHGTKDFWLAALRADGAALLAAVEHADVADRPVPSCPQWTVSDLARHLGAFYNRILTMAGSSPVDEQWPPLQRWEQAHAPQDGTIAWLGAQFAGLLAHLDSLEEYEPVWNWSPQPRTAGFWMRRAAHETAVHRWDAQLAIRLPEPIEAKLAGDTVTEALDTFLPAGMGRTFTGEANGLVRLTATDLGQEWRIRLHGTGVALLDVDFSPSDGSSRAEASGSASDLALALWGRVPFDVLEIAGDTELLSVLQVG